MSSLKDLQMLVEQEQFEEAIQLWEKIPQIERNTAEANNIMGILAAYTGELEQARKYLEQAKDIAPKDIDILFNLAFVVAQQNDIDTFRKTFNELYQLDLNDDTYLQLEEWKKVLYSSRQKKNVLMIAYYFPPLAGSGVFRSLKFAKYLQDYGWQPTIISAATPPNGWNFRDDTLMDEIPKNVQVIRIEDEISTGKSISVEISPIMDYQLKVFQYDPELAKLYRSIIQQGQKGIMQMLQFPHHDLYWTYKVSQYIEQHLDMKQFDVIYTTSGPYSAHVLGCYLKNKYQLPWVADYRDEWTGNPYTDYDTDSLSYKMLFALEKLLLKQASKNITVADGLVDVYRKRFGLNEKSVVSITNGYDEEDFQQLIYPQKKTEKFTIVYSGLLYGKERTITPFLEAIMQLMKEGSINKDKVQFRFIGSGGTDLPALFKRYHSEGIFSKCEYIAHRDALQYNIESNLLIMIAGDKECYQYVYTGKIFDYIRSNSQIIAVAPQKGVIDELFQDIGYGIISKGSDLKQIKKYILQEYQRWEQSETPLVWHHPSIARFERCHLTGKLADVLDTAQFQAVDFSSQYYDEGYSSGGAGQVYHKHYSQSFYYSCWQQAMRYLYLQDRDISILEVGCGAGQFANMLFDNGFHNYQGLDYAKEGIKLCKSNNPQYADRFFVADAFQTPILEEKHDLVIMFEILEHIQEDIRLLSRLPHNTKVLLSVPNFMDPLHVRCFTSEESVQQHYGAVIEIYDIQKVSIQQSQNALYYIVGHRK